MIFNFFEILKIRRKNILQFIRFIIVGGINTLFGYGIFLISLYFLSYLISSIISSIMGTTLSYFLNKRWTFRDKQSHKPIKIFKFYIVYGTGWLLNLILLIFFVEILKINPKVAWILAVPFVTTIIFFF